MTEERKAALRDLQAMLATAQATQVAAQPATATLIPKPRGTGGRGDFNLANAMNVDAKTCRQIQVSSMSHFSHHSLITSIGFRPLTHKHVNP